MHSRPVSLLPWPPSSLINLQKALHRSRRCKTLSKAAQSDTSSVTYGICEPEDDLVPLPEPQPFLDDDAPPKRPRCTRKESCKVREAREAEKTLPSSDLRLKKKGVILAPPTKRGRDYAGVADIEDVYLWEDGPIQCVVRWRSSLIAKDNLGSRVPTMSSKRLLPENITPRLRTRKPTFCTI